MNVLLILATFGVAAGLSISWRRRPLHPCFWLPPVFALYATWYSIAQRVRVGYFAASAETVLALGLIALACAAAGVGLGSTLAAIRWMPSWPRRPQRWRSMFGETPVFYVVVFLCFVSLAYVVGSGLTTKREIMGELFRANPTFAPLWVLFTVLAVRQILFVGLGNRAAWTQAIIAIVLAVLAWLVLGQRNFLFGFGLLGLLLALRRFPGLKAFQAYWIAMIALIVAIPITSSYKAMAVRETRSKLNALEDVFAGEFAAPGRNLELLLRHEFDLEGIDVISWEISRAFSSRALGGEGRSLSRWFNDTRRVQLRLGGLSGWGFTLIGAGYMFAGVIGVAYYMLFYGTVLGMLYRLSTRSFLWLSVYAVMIPISVYVLRQDMAYFAGALIKQAILPVAILVLFEMVLRQSAGKSKATRPIRNFRLRAREGDTVVA